MFEKKCGNCVYENVIYPCVKSMDCKNYSNWKPNMRKISPNEFGELNDLPIIEVDPINPSHYQTKNGLETINVIEAFTDELAGIEAVDTANVIKYICRWKKKNGIQDLKKAQWYLNHLIKRLEDEEKEIA